MAHLVRTLGKVTVGKAQIMMFSTVTQGIVMNQMNNPISTMKAQSGSSRLYNRVLIMRVLDFQEIDWKNLDSHGDRRPWK